MKPTPTDTSCPSADDLRRLLLGGLAEAESARLREHLRDCADCRRLWSSWQTEVAAPHTPPLGNPTGDTRAGEPARPAPDSPALWSSEVGMIGPGDDRPASPPRPPSAAPSFPFLGPPCGPGEVGWLAHYRITGVLGEGGMGYVFDAFDTQLHRRVALKTLKPDLAANASFRERFLQEARAAAALPDEYIITIYQVGLENGVPFLAMKFLHGESLESRLLRDGRLPAHEVLHIGREIALGLSAAHDRGLIHRDIKPPNLWLEAQPPDSGPSSGARLSCEYVYRVKILDFGLARPVHDARRLTATGLIVGTPTYLAPEQARGQPLDHRCDLFSLGVVLYRMVTGLLPFDGPDTLAQLTALAVADPRPVEEMAPETPAPLCDLIHRLLARDPADRPPTARAVAEQLRALEKGEAPPRDSAPPVRAPTPPPAREKPPSRRRWLAASGLLLLALGGPLAWRFLRPTGADHAAAPPASGEPIKVGLLFSLRGPLSVGGAPAYDAAELALAEINAEGGLLGRKVESVVGDGESESRRFAELAEKFITEDRVSVIVGTRSSANRKAVLPVVERHDSLLVYPMQFEGLEESPNIVYLGASPGQQMVPALDFLLGVRGKRRLFLVGSDYVFPRAANAVIRDHVTVRYPNAQILGEKYVPYGGSEVGDVVRAVKQAEPDLIVNTINGDANAAFFRALHQAGLRAERTPVLSFSLGENDLVSLGEAGVGHFAAWSYFQSIDRPENRAFVGRFRARYGSRRVVSDPMEATYAGVRLWAQAVQAAGTAEPGAVARALRGRSLEAPEGRVRIDPDSGYAWRVMRLGRVAPDGQFEILFSSETPLRPEPFPPTRTRAAWGRFLAELHAGWGGRWQAPQP